MKLDGKTKIQASVQEVWSFLTDPQAVARCAPGVQSVEVVTPDEHFRAKAAIGFGTVKVSFDTDVRWTELDPPRLARMQAHGDAPGSAVDAQAEMSLSALDESITELSWSAEVKISGTIASLASRMMGSITRKLTGQFFDCVRSEIEA